MSNKTSILTIAGIGVLAAIAYMYFVPKVISKTVVKKQTVVAKIPTYPPVRVNIPNNAQKPIQKDYLALYGRRR